MILALAANTLFGAALVEDGKKLKFFPTLVEELQEQLSARKKVRADLQADDKAFNSAMNAATEQLKIRSPPMKTH